MSDYEISELQEKLWCDINIEKEAFPKTRPLLAHYTSVPVLEQILKNDEIWFSNPLYMNDLEELRFGMNEGAAIFRNDRSLQNACSNDEAYAKLLHSFDYLFSEFDAKHAIDTYVMCLADHKPKDNDGVLSMWRGYGANANGVAIVFDTALIEPDDELPLIIGKVDYASAEERRAWITSKLKIVSEYVEKNSLDDKGLHAVAHYWLERLKLFALFTKHSGFLEEQEWRIVYMSERDTKKKLTAMIDYSITNRGVEPKLKLRLKHTGSKGDEGISLEKLIDRIILGPSISNALAKSSMQKLLAKNNKPDLINKVIASSIPFRP